MKWVQFILALSFLVSCTSAPTGPRKTQRDVPLQARAPETAPRKRLLVLPFLDQNPQRPKFLRDKARDRFLNEVARRQLAIVIDTDDLQIEFEKWIKNDEYDTQKVVAKAAELSAPAVLEGRILDLAVKSQTEEVGLLKQTKSVFTARVKFRLINTRTQKDLMNTTKTVELEDSGVRVAENPSIDRLLLSDPKLVENLVSDAFIEFVPQLQLQIEKLSWEGRIAMINGDRIYLNVGRITGLQLGDILRVSEEGEDVFDRQTGSFIGRSPGRIKGTVEVVNYFGADGSVAVIHSGGGFREDDKVEIY
jgi:hypothetical protein